MRAFKTWTEETHFILLVKNIHCQELWEQGRKNRITNISKDTFHILYSFIFASSQEGPYGVKTSLSLDI